MKKIIYITGAAIIGIVVMLGIILLLIGSGAITTEQTKLVIASRSIEGVYDGNPLVCNEWRLVSGVVKRGHALHVNVTGTQTAVGSSANQIYATVTRS